MLKFRFAGFAHAAIFLIFGAFAASAQASAPASQPSAASFTELTGQERENAITELVKVRAQLPAPRYGHGIVKLVRQTNGVDGNHASYSQQANGTLEFDWSDERYRSTMTSSDPRIGLMWKLLVAGRFTVQLVRQNSLINGKTSRYFVVNCRLGSFDPKGFTGYPDQEWRYSCLTGTYGSLPTEVLMHLAATNPLYRVFRAGHLLKIEYAGSAYDEHKTRIFDLALDGAVVSWRYTNSSHEESTEVQWAVNADGMPVPKNYTWRLLARPHTPFWMLDEVDAKFTDLDFKEPAPDTFSIRALKIPIGSAVLDGRQETSDRNKKETTGPVHSFPYGETLWKRMMKSDPSKPLEIVK